MKAPTAPTLVRVAYSISAYIDGAPAIIPASDIYDLDVNATIGAHVVVDATPLGGCLASGIIEIPHDVGATVVSAFVRCVNKFDASPGRFGLRLRGLARLLVNSRGECDVYQAEPTERQERHLRFGFGPVSVIERI